jgi:hypothetical protein
MANLAMDPESLLNTLDQRLSTMGSGQKTSKFDPIAFLNQHYATEASLVQQLPDLQHAVSERREALDERIAIALQRQSETAESTRRHIQEAQVSVVELHQRVLRVKEKASQSERAVLEITKDMKRLDCAKRHLQRTITTLKRLHMLVHAVEQLRNTAVQIPFPDYPVAAHLVDATHLLLQHFDGYISKVEPMRLLSEKVVDLQSTLRVGLVRGFRVAAFGPTKAIEMERAASPHRNGSNEMLPEIRDDVMPPTVMKGGVQLLDALGTEVRVQFIHEFCQDHLAEYLQTFAPASREEKIPSDPPKRVSSFKVASTPESRPSEAESNAGLDHVEKRFIWFRQILQDVDAKFPDVFPSDWNLQASMARVFLQLTRDHIMALLDGPRKDPDASNATILLKALQKTIVFEKEITKWLQQKRGTVFKSEQLEAEVKGTDENCEPIDPLIGIASAAYENYMAPYIELESQSMDEHLVEALEDRKVDTRGERPVFISSTNMFVYIKGSITRCTALTKGKAFFLLYQAFRDSLRKYAQILDGKLPSPMTGTSGNLVGAISIPASFGGSTSKQESSPAASYRLPSGEEVTVCHVISTCEYSADTVEALEDLIRDTVDEPYKSKIDMMSDQETFHDITAKAIRVLVSGLTNRTESALKLLAATNWAIYDSVGEESTYVRSMHEEIEPVILTLRKLLPTSYFRNFCDKFAVSFCTNYYDTVIRLKRISEPGTQQLLLDVYNLKTLFLKLPVLEKVSSPGKKAASGGSTIAPAMYTKMVQKHFGRIETLLKLVGTPIDLLIENFRVQWASGSALELQIVMSLKGMKRNEQAAHLEKFGLDPVNAMKGAAAGITGATIVSERVQALQDQGSTVASKVNSDLSQMRQKVDDFRKSFR